MFLQLREFSNAVSKFCLCLKSVLISSFSYNSVDRVASFLLMHGVVAFLPTLISSSPATYQSLIPRFDHIRRAFDKADLESGSLAFGDGNDVRENNDGDDVERSAKDSSTAQPPMLPSKRARILGLHLEVNKNDCQ
jgi:hypothetical protein